MIRFLLFLLVLSCARVGYPPGKPETNNPKLEINYLEKFNHFPITFRLKISDDTRIKSLKLFVNDIKIYDFEINKVETTFNIILDTIKSFSDTISLYNFRFEVSDIYDNVKSQEFKVYYKKEENPPIVKVLEQKQQELKIEIYDDTRLKSLQIFKNDTLLKEYNLFSKDTILTIKIDTFNYFKFIANDIYFNTFQKVFRFNQNK